MIIEATSDLHYKAQDSARMKELAKTIVTHNPDAFILAGDIATKHEDFHECLSYFDCFNGKKLAVLGNHDIWITDKTANSYQKAGEIIEILKEHDFKVLDENPVLIGRTAFVGNIGWYDYSFLRKELLSEFDFLNNPLWQKAKDIDERYLAQKSFIFVKSDSSEIRQVIWQDMMYAKWGKSDQEVTQDLVERLEKDIKSVYDSADNIIVVSHHLPFEALVIRKPDDAAWEITNAYMGSEKFGDMIKKYDTGNKKIKVISGHTHERRFAKIGNIECATVALQRESVLPYRIDIT